MKLQTVGKVCSIFSTCENSACFEFLAVTHSPSSLRNENDIIMCSWSNRKGRQSPEIKTRALGLSRQFSNTQQGKLWVVETVGQVDVVDQLLYNVHSSGISPITGHTHKKNR